MNNYSKTVFVGAADRGMRFFFVLHGQAVVVKFKYTEPTEAREFHSIHNINHTERKLLPWQAFQHRI